jgi:hypothetical protein
LTAKARTGKLEPELLNFTHTRIAHGTCGRD